MVVPTRNRPDRLATCLAALRAELHLAAADGDEIIVVDSASADTRTRQVVASAGLRFVRSDLAGASLARNLGWRTATHRFVAFIDDDVLVQPGWAAAVVAGLSGPAPGGFVTGAILDPEEGEKEGRGATHVEPQPRIHNERSYGAIGGSGNLAVDRTLLERVGGFDERLGPGTWFATAEDYDLFDRMLLSGAVGRYEPAARVVHDDGRDKMARLRLAWLYGKGAGARLARLAWTSPHRFIGVWRDLVWRGGIRVAAKQIRQAYEYGLISTGLYLAGATVGFLVGIVVFAPPHRGTAGAGRSTP